VIEKGQGLAIVDFWAAWCGPCRMVAPIMEQLAGEYAGRLKVAKVDVDANQQISMKYNIRSIPSILFFKDGKHVDTVVGACRRRCSSARSRSTCRLAAGAGRRRAAGAR
jgi:thioredoxin 1